MNPESPNRPKERPDQEVALLELGAAELARLIRAREVTVTEVVERHLDRIGVVNPLINAVVTPMFDDARNHAQAADQRIEADGTGDLPPLFGVPVTVKDCWPVEGVRFTSGSWFHRDELADRDALVVTRIRDAGAIILGKTNCPDMCWGFETVNPVFGRTLNPRSPRHSAGGSSGGEAAIIAAGGSPLGVGSDIGGSLRNPAAVNGCVSIKPTTGRVPTNGHMPAAEGAIESFNHGGPLARRVEDLSLALSILDGGPPIEDRAISGVSCVVNVRSGLVRANREVTETVIAASGALASAGMEITRNDKLPIDRMGMLYTHLLRDHSIEGVRRDLGGGSDYNTLRELLRGFGGRERISKEALTIAAYVKYGGLLAPLQGDRTFADMERYEGKLLEAIGDGVLLCPLLLSRPPKHGATWMPFTQIPYASPFNATGMPAAIVPVRWTEDGLPMSVQVVAKKGADDLVLSVAAELESAFGGWKMAEPAFRPSE